MGPLFAKMLHAYEYCERMLIESKRTEVAHMDGAVMGNAVLAVIDEHSKMNGGQISPEWMDNYIHPLVHRWGNDARQLRSAFKFKTTMPTLETLANDALTHGEEMLFNLPFEECVLVVDDIKSSDFGTSPGAQAACLFIEERYYTPDPESDPGPWYADNGVHPGDKFACITPAYLLDNNLFTLLPVEYHATIGRAFDGPDAGNWCSAFPEGTPPDAMDLLEAMGHMTVVLVGGWLAALQHPGVAVEQTAGLKPGVKHRAPKHKERRFYEHKMVTIDPLSERIYGDGTGYGGKHRLHPVRGFWRRYKKTGKRVWIRPHWRGDKELGVITHDYEVKHEADDLHRQAG